jgi:hypothetical protein
MRAAPGAPIIAGRHRRRQGALRRSIEIVAVRGDFGRHASLTPLRSRGGGSTQTSNDTLDNHLARSAAPEEKLLMHHTTPNRTRKRGRVFLLAAIAAFAATAAPAHAQAPGSAKVTSTESAGMRSSAATRTTTFASRSQAAPSSWTTSSRSRPAPGARRSPATRPKSRAFKSGNKFKEFNVLAGNGNDDVVNQTSGAGLSNVGAPMRANGGPGDDELTGDNKAKDVLFGASQNDELHGGGGGINELDGGVSDERSTAAPAPTSSTAAQPAIASAIVTTACSTALAPSA